MHSVVAHARCLRHSLVCPAVTCRVEFLCHDISVHVPHHVSSKIPWYNLRKAYASLKQNWGEVRGQRAVVGGGMIKGNRGMGKAGRRVY